MDAFWIWNPRLVSADPPALELFVTEGEITDLSAGTQALMTDILSALGVDAEPSRWSFERYRTGYFTSYPDSPDWEDRWAQAWRVDLELSAAPELDFDEHQIGLDSIDDSWDPDSDPAKATSSRCLILADFEHDAALELARAAASRLLPTARLRRGRALGALPQLQIEVGELPCEVFAADVPEARPLLEELGRLGASLRFTESVRRLRERARR